MQKLTYLLTFSLTLVCLSMKCHGADADKPLAPTEPIEIEYFTKEKIDEKLALEEKNAEKYRQEQALLMQQLIEQIKKSQAKELVPQEEEQTQQEA